MQYMIYDAIMTTNGLLGGISNEINQVTDAVIANTAAIENFNASVSSRLRYTALINKPTAGVT